MMDICRLVSDQPDDSLKMVEIDFQALCRICGALGENLTSVFGKRAADRLRERIGKYLQIEILAEDCLPTKVCDDCRETLDRFHELFEKCHRTDEKFRTMLSSAEELKEIEEDAKVVSAGATEDEDDMPNDEAPLGLQRKDDRQDDLFDKKGESIRHSIGELSLNLEQRDSIEYFEEHDDFYGEYQFLEPKLEHIDNTNYYISNSGRVPTIPLEKAAIKQSKVVTEDKIYYKCGDCGKQMSSSYTYQAHLRIHNGERPYTCPHCQQTFRISQGLNRHVREVHEKLRPYLCEICQKGFGNSRNLSQHRLLHTNERSYSCDICEKTFNQKANLYLHKRTHGEKRDFVCPVCSRGFYTRVKLRLHETIHSDDRNHTCTECGQSFRSRRNLVRHWKNHSTGSPYECAICANKFKQKRYLLRHLKTQHREDRPLQVGFDGVEYAA
ncbi:zinc finger and SCAN domain-containing protein 2-like isoform X2 [Topomyia yanbarensis]|uniref:zinc finger and SCAN domain-containing protein 2-like isoform X2 n=1 Tax=Topomyia yanbarensis TaxID=2498891 RepID=UPI00273BB4A8|nr:zinc finger and SCAN domain-containing protein 2-like isoform X2 [Topomyia yanbarensis]